MSRLAVPLRLLLAALAGAAALAAAVALWLWATESLLVVQRNGGDQSQSSAIDLSPRPPAEPLPVVAAQEVENVVLLIGDGMGFSHVLAARSELVGLNGRLFFERFPFTGWQTTHALESLYTDSAASASSLATGRKVPYRALSADAGGRALRTVAEAARDRGMAVGLVTDSYLWDATMAAFVAHVASRRMTDEVIRQMAYSRIDLLAGEVHESLPAEGGLDDGGGLGLREVVDLFRQGGFAVARTPEELPGLAEAETPVAALFEPGRIADPERAPELVELADFALERLADRPGGFFLVVETEEPDSGAHRRELSRIVRGIRALDQVARRVVDRALADGSTLVLVTADHETGGIDLLHGDAEHRLGVRWSTVSHSAEPVPIYAFGAGAERFSGVKDNTELPRVLSELLGLDLFGESAATD